MKKLLTTASLSASRAFDGGLFYMLGDYLLRLARLVILLMVWRSLAAQGADLGEFSLQQLLVYTLLASVLSDQLNVVTPATTAFWEGSLISRYLRPLPILVQLMAETVGSWLPGLLLYSVPMLLLSPFIGLFVGIPLIDRRTPFLLSLLLSIMLGFALDFLFAALVIRLKNANYAAYSIRQAITKLFSGAVIPFALLPWGVGNILERLPFASLASAPLLIFVGFGDPGALIGDQLFWNIVLWPLALFAFRRSQERMVSYGG